MREPRTKPRPTPTTAHLRELRAIRKAMDDVRLQAESRAGPIRNYVVRTAR